MFNEVNAMVCNSCGRNINNENANFCEYCGASVREGSNYYQSEPQNASAQVPPHTPMQAIEVGNNEKPVSFLNWLGTHFIKLIPFVGGLVYFVMLLIWSFDSNTAESKRNWARAKLVYMLVMFLIAMVFVIMIIMMFNDPVFKETFWESFNKEMELYEDLYKNYSY
ncbi:MAG TPA: zinc ribbon domain-containing protein [Clostridiales bacterium]|jgi:ribosomal protein L37E|nr:zinc ribbon domain-containing protein [Clostridiales bacterium]